MQWQGNIPFWCHYTVKHGVCKKTLMKFLCSLFCLFLFSSLLTQQDFDVSHEKRETSAHLLEHDAT